MSPLAPLRAEDPEQLGTYRLEGRLGRGGQGVVFFGRSPGGAPVAVKLMHSRLDEEKARRRFIGEVEAVRRVAPFCTAQLLHADLDGDRPYIVSEYVDGVSLQEHITAEGPRTGGSLDRVAVGTATALAAIHGAGVVHRDFKPGNVLLGADGPRVIDFGISRLMNTTATTGRVPIGTPAYLSPEQLKGERAGPPADMFGWALTVAFTSSGRHAYAANSFEATLGRILFGEADLDPLTGSLREIVVACLAEDPSLRPSAEEVLRRLIGHGAPPLPAQSPGEVLETGATLASQPQPAGGDGPTNLPFTPHDHQGPSTLTFAPVDDGPSTLTFTPRADDHEGPSTLGFDAHRDDHEAPGTPSFPPRAAGHEGEAPITSAPEASGHGLLETDLGPAARTGTRWRTVVAGTAVLAAGVIGVALWQGNLGTAGNASPDAPATFSYAGRWTGSAEHPTAGRVFPVEILLKGATGPGTMRWGADLHCTGRLTRLDGQAPPATFRLDQVRGDQCHPSTVEISPEGPDQMAFSVTRPGETSSRYSGTASRSA
ncbi:serine/threonine-protein kinase [Sphaerisporangium sp. NPDC088356]|uniref:serine/threonine-protein kinase n=1 Tax=Sphaerisporangium sp. NPDC088356 TaxID=3154871 RepID=UPI00342E360E